MKIVSWNTRGLKNPKKDRPSKVFLKSHNLGLALIQESKKEVFYLCFVKSLRSYKVLG